MMSKAVKAGLSGEAGDAFVDFVVLTGEQLTESKTLHAYIGDIYKESLHQYEKRNFVYALVVKAALASDVFSPENVATVLQRKLREKLAQVKVKGTPEREAVVSFIWKQADRLEHNQEWQERIEAYKIRFYRHLISRPDMKEAWQRYVLDEDRQSRVCYSAASYAIERLESWKSSPDQVDQLNRYILALAARELKRVQEWFGKTAEEEILKYDTGVLAKQLESGVWYDLQMIRINGSLVGAALGTLIYIGMFIAKGGQ
jgi:hypothetical protein